MRRLVYAWEGEIAGLHAEINRLRAALQLIADEEDISQFRATHFTIPCGTGQVIISFDTGKVEFKDCTPDEGAKAFWDAIERMYPRR